MAEAQIKLGYILDPLFQVENNNGKPVVGGHIEVYEAGTNIKYITYQNFDYTQNPFKIPLGSDGRAVVLGDVDLAYDVYVRDSFGNLIVSRLNVAAGDAGGAGGGGLREVIHDNTLTGKGTQLAPLGVSPLTNLAVDETLTAYEATISGQDALVLGVNGDWFNNQMASAFEGKVDTSAFEECCSAVNVALDNKADIDDLSNFYTKTETYNNFLPRSAYLNSGDYYEKSETYNRLEIESLVSGKQSELIFGYDSDSAISSINNSAIGGQGASYPASAEDAVQYVVNNSATINEVNNTYESNSGSYLTAHQSLTGYLTTGDANTISSMFSGAIDYVSANAGQSISGDYELSAGDGVTLTDFPEDHITRIDVTAGGGGVTGEYVPLSSINCAIGSANTVGDQFTTASNFAQGRKNTAKDGSFAQGAYVYSDDASLAQGYGVSAYAGSFAQGGATSAYLQSIAQGHGATAFLQSIAQGEWTSASNGSIAQGYYSSAEWNSFSQGYKNLASRDSFAQGSGNSASNESFAQGCWNSARLWSFAQGQNNSAINVAQALGLDLKITRGMAIGQYNKTDSAAFVIGQGSDTANRADIFVINHDGSVSAAGKISANGVELGAGGTVFPITGTDGTASFTADMNSSALYLSTAQGVAGLTTKFTGKGVQYQAYPSTDISASWYNIIKGANISSLKLTTAQASYSFTTDEIRHLSQINVATPYTYSGPSTYSVTLGTKTFSNLDSGCYYDFMRAEVEGSETWVIGPTGAYSLL